MENHNQSRFTEHARAALLRSGWIPQRVAAEAVAAWQQALTQKGIELFYEARRILEEFGGLRLLREGASPQRILLGEFVFFDPMATPFDRPSFDAIAATLGTPLCPIGTLQPTNTPVAVAADRRVFALAKPARMIGGNIDAAVEAIVAGKEFIVPFTPDGSQRSQSAPSSGSSDAFVAYRCDEGPIHYYLIEDRVTHVAAIRVSRLERKARALTIHYETIGYAMPPKSAASIIQRCLLVEFNRDAFTAHIDEVCYVDSSSGRPFRLAYASP